MYSWYRQGFFACGELKSEPYDVAKSLLSKCNWDDGELVYDKEYSESDDTAITRYVEGRFNLKHCPYDAHILSDLLLRSHTMSKFQKTMVNPMYEDTWWLKDLRLVDFNAWNTKSEQPWHSDYGPFDVQVLLYFNDTDQDEGGHLVVGNKNEDGLIFEVHRHVPKDGTWIMIQPNNPYFLHRVESGAGSRTVLELRYRIDG